MKKKVLVAGCGISGIGAAKLLIWAGESVCMYDSRKDLDTDKIRSQVFENVTLKEGALREENEPEFIFGELPAQITDRVSYCVISPGIPLDMPFVQVLKDSGIPVWSEIELAWHYGKGTVIGITGTNGKTTTTSLTGAVMENAFGKDRTFVVGNIGTAYTGKADKTDNDSIVVAEISSFQLETILTFHPKVSAILNITPDHLNRHKTMENYIAVKESITKNQDKTDYCVLNYDDPALRAFGAGCPAKVVWFSSRHELDEGFFMREDALVCRMGGREEMLGKTKDFHLVGRCNYENIMAAAAIAVCMGVPFDVIRKTAMEFRAVEHRIEYTAVKKGVTYYNDSKGTNPDAAIQGIRAMTTPTCLIGGGYDKGSAYDEWVEEFAGTVKYLVLIGQTAEDIAKCCDSHGFTAYEFADNMEEAVRLCAKHALPGEAVLLSPACASWGMFDNYEQRGRIFEELVHKLPD